MPNRSISDDELSFNLNLGKNLKYLRKQKNWTQTKVAEGLSVSFQQIQKYEKGLNAPSPTSLCKLAQMFKCSMDRLCSENLIHDLKTFKEKIENLEIATADGVAVPLEGMSGEIEALTNKLRKNSQVFVNNKPLVFKFKKPEEVDPWL
jgi:transcriptional regulator with XRE-family HTH domain